MTTRIRKGRSAAAPHPPRVMHVVRKLGVGGLEVGVVNVVLGLDRLGFEQAVCCLECLGDLAVKLPVSVPTRSCGTGDRGQRVPWRAAQWIRSWRPDVIHARNGGAWIDAATAWIMAGRRGRLAFSFHGWSRLNRMPRRQAWLFRGLASLTHSMAAVSDEAARQFAGEVGISPGRFIVLSSGVDTVRFKPADQARHSSKIVIGCVGRLDPVKDHKTLIDAFALALSDGARNLELRLIGDGPCRSYLERLVCDRGLVDHVRFLGMTSDIPEQLRELNLFVLASRREGRPTSIMEAMASGIPVIATRVGSVPELVVEGRTGWIVESGDVTNLGRTIGMLADDEKMRRQLGDEARRIAVAELSLDRMVDEYAAFYRQIIRES